MANRTTTLTEAHWPDSALPRVSIIMPVYNNPAEARRTLASCLGQRSAHDFEVIVVDNGSKPPLALELSDPRVVLVSEPRPGSYAARNAGAERARGRLLAFIDAGCLADADWLDQGVAALEHDPRIILAGQISVPVLAQTSALQWWQHYSAYRQDRYAEGLNFAATANCFVARAVFEELGRFDERLYSSGDLEFGLRAARRGVIARYGPLARVLHPPRQSLSEIFRKTVRIAKGQDMIVQMGYTELGHWGLFDLLLSLAVLPIAALTDLWRRSRADRLGTVLSVRIMALAVSEAWARKWARLLIKLGWYRGQPRV